MVPKDDRSRLRRRVDAAGLVAIDERRSPRPADLDSTWTIIPVSRRSDSKCASESSSVARRARRSSVDRAGARVFLGVLSCPDLALVGPVRAVNSLLLIHSVTSGKLVRYAVS